MKHGPVVVKLGGELLVDPAGLDRIAGTLAATRATGIPLMAVHGGGPQVTELQRAMGIEPQIVAGRRITDRGTIDVAKLVFAGRLNTDFVAALGRHGARPVGLTGADARLLRVRQRPPVTLHVEGEPRTVDYGFVGDVVGVDPSLLHLLMGHGYIPVLCSLAADDEGRVLNVNADTVAAAVAAALAAERLLVLTTVPGVYRDADERGDIWSTLDPAQAQMLIADGTAGGGMAPKLAACLRAIESGVAMAAVLDGCDDDALATALLGARPHGTVLEAQPAPPALA